MNKEERLIELRDKLLATKVGETSIQEVFESSSVIKTAFGEVLKLTPVGHLLTETLKVSLDPQGLFVGCKLTRNCIVLHPNALTELRDAIDDCIKFFTELDKMPISLAEVLDMKKTLAEYEQLLNNKESADG